MRGRFLDRVLHALGVRFYFTARDTSFATLSPHDVARMIDAFLDRDETFCEPDALYEFPLMQYRAAHLEAAKADLNAIRLQYRTAMEPDGWQTPQGREALRALAAKLRSDET